jgi:hypothetical protein
VIVLATPCQGVVKTTATSTGAYVIAECSEANE